MVKFGKLEIEPVDTYGDVLITMIGHSDDEFKYLNQDELKQLIQFLQNQILK